MSIETRPRILATGERVRLRTIGLRDIELLDAWRASAEFWSAFNDFGLQFPSLRKAVEEGRTIGEDGGNTLVELLDGTIIGTMSWHAVTYGPNLESRAWNIGITLAPAARGNGWAAKRSDSWPTTYSLKPGPIASRHRLMSRTSPSSAPSGRRDSFARASHEGRNFGTGRGTTS